MSKKKHQRIEETSSVQDAFEREFSILPSTIKPTTTMMIPWLEVEDLVPTNRSAIEDDEEMHLEFNGKNVEDSDGEGNSVVEQVSFSPADEFDVLEVLAYGI